MIPIGDSLRSRTFPFVNYGLILANFIVFFYELSLPNLDAWTRQWGAVPCLITGALQGSSSATCAVGSRVAQVPTGPSDLVTLLTSMFIHGGWLHILGNMLFLWVFGDNVEDALGHAGYLIFYLVCGIGAGLGQVFFSDPEAALPAIGASGAIAGVLAGYLVLYPRASVRTIIPIFIIPWIVRIPAFVLMLFWFATQVLSSSLFAVTPAVGGSGGVAYMAHVTGFLLGLLLVFLFRGKRRSIDLEHQWPGLRS
jgi:membrane associated rhomboid family serine protease